MTINKNDRKFNLITIMLWTIYQVDDLTNLRVSSLT